MRFLKLITPLIFVATSSAFGQTGRDTNLASKGACSIYDGKVRTEVGTFKLDHAEALAGSCPSAIIKFTIPNSSAKYLVRVEHQALFPGVFTYFAVLEDGKSIGRSST